MDPQDPIKALLLETYIARRDVLKRFLKARTGSGDMAEDLVQEMFFRLDRAAPDRDVQNPLNYLFKMALNLAHDHRRERARAQNRDAQWMESRLVFMADTPVADIASAEAAYDAKQRLGIILSALQDLSPQCRRVFILHKFEYLSHAEIAAQTGIARSTVEKHMGTAVRHLVKRLG